MLRLFLLSLSFILVNSSAHAESFLLRSYKNWKVEYVQTDTGATGCSATVSGDGLSFSILVASGKLFGMFTQSGSNYGTGDGEIYIWVDRKTKWTSNATANGSSISFKLDSVSKSREFLWELARGNKLYMSLANDNTWDFWYSLHGSRVALSELSKCKDNL